MSHDVRIKICGITDQPALDAAIEGKADFIGFVRWNGSPRFIDAATAEQLASSLPTDINPVGLFVDAPLEEMLECPFEWIQLHGSEEETTAHALKDAGKQVIRGFRFDPDAVRRWDACHAIDRVLVDGSRIGGTGEGFDHANLAGIMQEITTPLFIAGGLGPGNVADAITQCPPWGVDVSSGVEHERGRKDPALIRAFCDAVRNT